MKYKKLILSISACLGVISFNYAYSSTPKANHINTQPTVSQNSKQLSIFWCGFGSNYCGQSDIDDVYPKATIVIMAFANSNPDGTLSVDTMPKQMIDKWHKDGKKVLISIGGQNGHWDSLFANPDNFVNSLVKIVKDNNLDGVDLDIEGYTTPPNTVSKTIHTLREKLGQDSLIVVSPENVTVYPDPSIPVPSGDTGGQAWNYFVPIIKQEINDIDYIQPQFYNNGYISGVPGSAEFIVSNYLGWMNKLSSYQIPDFEGVPANKLIMGLLASPSAGRSEFYAPAAEIEKAVNELDKMNINIGGIMFWDSHWDEQNSYTVGKASAKALGLE